MFRLATLQRSHVVSKAARNMSTRPFFKYRTSEASNQPYRTRRNENTGEDYTPRVNPATLLKQEYTMPELTADKQEIAKFLKDNEIEVKGTQKDAFISRFDDLSLPEAISSILNAKFEQPTPVQKTTLPISLGGRDLIGVSQTGSGKTLSFLIPLMMHVLNRLLHDKSAGREPIGLVLAPTRELTEQIKAESIPYCMATGLSTATAYGGSSRSYQLQRLQRNPHLIYATPGRLLDFLDRDETTMRNVSFLVLDEADRMLDMGFEPQIRDIIDQTSKTRQTLMWSATWPKEVRSLANDFLNDPAYLQVGSRNLTANSNIKQIIVKVDEDNKYRSLVNWINQIKEQNGKALIFMQTKRGVLEVERRLSEMGVDAVCLQGDMEQRVKLT